MSQSHAGDSLEPGMFSTNSEFTYKHIIKYYNKEIIDIIEIVYPPCNINNSINNNLLNKKDNTFIIIGRIFKHTEKANNKYINLAINIFNSYPNLELNIVGSIKSIEYYNELKSSIKHKNIHMHTDVSDEIKNDLISKSKFYINFTGFNDKHIYCEEHFGISYVEALSYGCYPISINKGWPALYINETQYGTIINNESEFIKFITNKNLNSIKNKIINLEKFNYKNFKINLR